MFTSSETEFCGIIKSLVQKSLLAILEQNKENISDAFSSFIYNTKGQKVINHNASRDETFLMNKIFRPYLEIIRSIERIDIIINLFKNQSLEPANISKCEILRYHYTNFLNEMYIFKERLINYLKLIRRSYKNDEIDFTSFDALEERIESTLKPILTIRGAHVHSNYYTDDDLDRISSLELLINESEVEEKLGNLIFITFEKEYIIVLDKFLKTIIDYRKLIDIIVEVYFTLLISLITSNGKLIFPGFKCKSAK